MLKKRSMLESDSVLLSVIFIDLDANKSEKITEALVKASFMILAN